MAPGIMIHPVRSVRTWATIRGEAAEDGGGRRCPERQAADAPFARELFGGRNGDDGADRARDTSENHSGQESVGRRAACHQPKERDRQDRAQEAENDQDRFPANPVGQGAGKGRDEDDGDGCRRGEPERVALIELTCGRQECRNVGDPDIIGDRTQGGDGERSQNAGAMVGEGVKKRARGRRSACLLPFEVRGFFHCRAGDSYASRQNRADEKRDAPSPRVQTRRAHRIDGHERNADGKQPPDLTGRGGQRRDQAPPAARRAFQQIGDDRDILAADRKPHDAAEKKSSQPAAAPTCACVGNRAVPSIVSVISATDKSIVGRRPNRSPIWPKTKPPSGRNR